MKTTMTVFIAAAIAAAAWFLLVPSQEARVKKAFAQTAATLEKSGREPPLDAMGKARALAELAEAQCVLEYDGASFTLAQERSAMASRIATLRNMSSRIHVAFKDVSVSFPDSATAEASCGFVFEGDDLGTGVRDARSIEAVLHKDGESGKWRFSRVRAAR